MKQRCIDCKVESVKLRSSPKIPWKEVFVKDVRSLCWMLRMMLWFIINGEDYTHRHTTVLQPLHDHPVLALIFI